MWGLMCEKGRIILTVPSFLPGQTLQQRFYTNTSLRSLVALNHWWHPKQLIYRREQGGKKCSKLSAEFYEFTLSNEKIFLQNPALDFNINSDVLDSTSS